LLLRLDDLEKRIGNRVLFTAASAVVRAGDRIGIVGPNGAGKTTLLHTLAGEEPCDAGRLHRARGIRIGMLRQEIDPRSSRSVREEARSALAELDALEEEIRRLEGEMSERAERGEELPERLARRYDQASTRFAQGGGFERHARVAEILAGLGFDEDAADHPLSSFSGGWLMRVELAKLLLAQPDVLLLDEPTNHLDLPSIQFFESTLERFPGAVLVVSHDRTFLRRHMSRIVELDGRGRFTLYEGGYDRYLADREQRREELLARKANQDRQIAETERFIERFRAKATKARQVQSRIRALEKTRRVEVDDSPARRMRLRIPAPPRSGERVLSLEHLHKRYGDAPPLYEDIDFHLFRGEKVALVGPNGAGKSTLLRIAAGRLDFESGERILGHNVQPAFFAQHQLEALDPDASVLEELARDAHTDEIPRLRGHLGAFLFTGDDVEKKIGVLSGGEKARVALAKLLLRPANLLILDEPTNHLDVEACEILEEALREFQGTLLFVSHDRAFINALATRLVDVDHGHLEDHLGNYDAYLERRQRAAAADPSLVAAAQAPSPPTSPITPGESPASTAASATASATTDKQARMRERERRKTREKTARKIEKLEGRIAQEEARKEALAWRLGEPEVYRDAERSRALQSEQREIEAAIEALYLDWERLSDELAALEEACEP
jgi:ATP-binding cassette subfamily F protein 3